MDVTEIRARVAHVQGRIEAAGRDPQSVRIVAVTKTFGPEAVHAALAAGLEDIGENYSDELIAKATALTTAESLTVTPRWHYLGAIQRRKVRDLSPFVNCWQTVCRTVEAESIASHAPGATVLIQVDTTDISGRNGCRTNEVEALVRSARDLGLDVAGLMTVAAPGTPEATRNSFKEVAYLARCIGLRELSMGMTDDYEVAVSEGATMIRLGRHLFGERPPNRSAEP